jgi:hypothetical protein
MKTWSGGMEMESTGDMVSLIEDINNQDIELEDIDLDKVDKEIEDQERAADEKYNNFDAEQLRLGESDLQEGWKVGTDLSEGWKTRIDLPEGWKTRSDLPEGWKLARETTTCKETDESQEQQITSEEVLDYSQRMEKKIDKLRMKWAGSDYAIVLEKLEMMESGKRRNMRME